jgi:CRISPR/Cas system CMR-associated protein Cmr5 small subunit
MLRKDQELALWAYQKTESVKNSGANNLQDYEIAIQTFAAVLLRNGLEVAASVIERNLEYDERQRPRPNAYWSLLTHLAEKALPGIAVGAPAQWPGNVRNLADVGKYMVATREIRARITWLRRACRAIGT